MSLETLFDIEETPDDLGETRKPKRGKKGTSYPALLITQNKHRFYFSTIPVDDLFPGCFVTRRDEDPAWGFQRALNESRAEDIATYLAAGSGSIPSNIVLSAQDAAHFSYSPRLKTISFERVPFAFLVIDGQHRLWGYQKCSVRHRVPVAIYEGLSRAEEAKLFIDINTTQRGVPAALLLDIKQIAEIETAKEQMLRDLFDRFQKDPKSPLAGRLSASKSVAGKISRVTFNRALSPILSGSILLDLDPSHRNKLILNYLNAFDAELGDKKLLTRSALFEAIFEIFDEVVRAAITIHGSAKQSDLQKLVRPLARLDFSPTSGGQSFPSKKAIVALMLAALRKSVPISSDML
jgi:DGQHR domain-containing protein